MFRRILPYLAYSYLTLVKWTTRLKIVGEDRRGLLRRENRRFIYAFWHNRQMFFTCSHRQDRLSVLVSRSRDGELIAETMRLSKIRASRGSSTRGFAAAIKEMMALVDEGWDLGITPDGPKGPAEQVKPGAVFIARKLGIPILPISNALSFKLTMRSWDRYQVPLPFGRAAIAYGEPILVASSDDAAQKARELESALNAASRKAEEALTPCRSARDAFLISLVLAAEALLFPFAGLFFLLKFLFSSRRRILLGLGAEIQERFGILNPRKTLKLQAPVIWVHAASAGEAASLTSFLRLLRERVPGAAIFLTSTNGVGVRRAESLNLAEAAALAPLDFPWAIGRFLSSVRPALLILVETELWPRLIALPSRRNIPVCLISATLSERSFKRYRSVSPFVGPFLRRMSRIAVQSEADAERFKELGAGGERLMTVGSLKYDASGAFDESASREAILALGWGNNSIFVAASTHPGEEETVVEAYARARALCPSLKLVVAPRHVERAAALRAVLDARGIANVFYSKLVAAKNQNPSALILDVFGILGGFYGRAVLTFVGGTWVDLGGHSLIEPALSGSPLAFGTSTFSNEGLAELLESKEAGFRVKNAAELAEVLSRLSGGPEEARRRGERARGLARSLGGASARTIEALKDVLDDLK